MIHFAYSEFLLLIFLIPFFFIFYYFYKRARKRELAKLGDLALIERLMPTKSKAKGWVRLSFFALAWFFFAIGLARPQMGAKIKESRKSGTELMIALDVSNSMLAEDYTPNRLERAKLAISRLVDKMQGDRMGLIVFAGRSFVQLPITTDYVSAKIFLNSISNTSVPVQGTNIAEAITTGIMSFSSDANQGENNRAIIIISDGENHEGGAVEAAKSALEVGVRVFCIGVGSPEGKPIPINGELLKDKDGNIVVSKLDEQGLAEIASVGGGAYIRAGNTEFGLNPIIDELNKLQESEYNSVVFEDFDEQYMYFFAIALFFFILEFLVGNRRVSKRMFSILLLLLLSVGTISAQVDKKEIRKGGKFFKDGAYKEAEVEYRKGLLKDSTSVAGNYNLGNTLYRENDFANAHKYYNSLLDSIAKVEHEVDWSGDSKEIRESNESNLYHNLGNSCLQQKDYAGAVEAFKNSLRLNPNDMETKANYIYAKKKLEDQQDNKNQGGGGDNNDNQDNNQDNKEQDKDQNKDNNQDNKEQNKDQNNDQNNDKEQNNRDNQGDNGNDNRDNKGNNGKSPKISPSQAEQLLKAMQDKENKTKEKVNEEKAKLYKKMQSEKNW